MEIIIPPVSATHGFARSLPAKLERLVSVSPDASDGVQLQLSEGEKKKICLLKDQLRQIGELLLEPSEVEFPASAVRCWMQDVRELSYDIDDFHDELVSKYSQKSPQDSNMLTNLCRSLQRSQWISSEISRFRIRLEKASQRYKAYRLHESKKRQQSSIITSDDDDGAPPPLCGLQDARPVGIGDSAGTIEKWLTDEGEPKLRVVAVVGPGGIGKTTLAKELYRSLRKRFRCRAFVRSSQIPDMRKLLTTILLQVRPHTPPSVSESSNLTNLTNTLRTCLTHKKYFIVINGLWALSTWDLILQALPDDGCFSRILTTTEVDAVGHRCCGHNSDYILRMKPLSNDKAHELFFSRFDGKQPEVVFLKEISSRIVSKCGGFPLAIISVSSLVPRQHRGKIEKWSDIWSSLSSNLKINSTVEGMKQVLSLCYNSLPGDLKTCMLYLSIYKQGSIIKKNDLVQQWIAEGFISVQEGKTMEEVAISYFNELVTKGMIQPLFNSHNGQLISCTVHHIILQHIQCKSIEENFVITIHHSETNVRLGDKVRRLSIDFGDAKDPKPPEKLELSQVRTLAFYGGIGCMPSLAEFRLLRVIILDLWGDQDPVKLEIPTFCRLGYLEIACNVKLILQIQVQSLQYLETLKIDSRSEVPKDIVDLPRLLHLSLRCDTNLPNFIGHMSSLRTFGCFNLSSNSADNVQSLEKLTNLFDLRLTCSTTMLCDNLEKNFKILSSVLPKLNNLKSLTLLPADNSSSSNILGGSSSDDKTIHCDRLLPVSSPPALIEKLELSPRICILSSLPGWIGNLSNLSILKIAARVLSQSEVDSLNNLWALCALSLYVSIAPSKWIVLKEGFRVLKHFKFVCTTLCLSFEKGAMPDLRSLKLGFNTNRMDQYSLAKGGFDNLKRLSVFSAKIGCAGALEQGEETKSALVKRFSGGERKPIINIDFVDRVFYGDKEIGMVDQIDQPQTLEKADVDEPYETEHRESSSEVESSKHGISITQSTGPASTTKNPAIISHPGAGMDIVAGPVGNLISKLGELLHAEYKLQKGLPEQIESLKTELESAHAALLTVGETPPEQVNRQLRLWASEVREASYDMEDILDSFLVEVVEAAAQPEKKDGKLIKHLKEKMAKLFKKSKARHSIAGTAALEKESTDWEQEWKWKVATAEEEGPPQPRRGRGAAAGKEKEDEKEKGEKEDAAAEGAGGEKPVFFFSAAAAAKTITLVSCEGHPFRVSEEAARLSAVLADMIDSGCAGDNIPVPNVDDRALAMVIKYFDKHAAAADETDSSHGAADDEGGGVGSSSGGGAKSKASKKALDEWDRELVGDLTQDALFDLITAANFLDIKGLLEAGCQKAADMIASKTPAELCAIFGIVNDFTAEAPPTTVDPRLVHTHNVVAQIIGIERIMLIAMLQSSSDGHGDAGGSGSSNKMKIVSVVGAGGLGKTTLAQAVYEELSPEYDCRAFVSVGRKPDLVQVFVDIFFRLDKEEYKAIRHVKNLQLLSEELRKFLHDKRYFIVIDDVWDVKSWQVLGSALDQKNSRSRVIKTTRNLEVACSDEVYRLDRLTDENSKKLFYMRLFGGEDKCPPNHPEEASEKILQKCGGVPLAIITMASLLVGKSRQHWFELCSSPGFYGGRDNKQLVDDTVWILSLSYYDLPSHLKTCLLYLSVYPEDYKIEKDLLIWKWIAEGFIEKKEGRSMFQLGEDYFHQLINRSMIQGVESEYEGIIHSCRVHDMVLDLIRDLSCEENFITISNDEGGPSSQHKVRRLAHQRRILLDQSHLDSHREMTQLRSFVAHRCDIHGWVLHLSFKLLRVLALEMCTSSGNDEYYVRCSLEHLGNLVHLRYLGLRGTMVRELPEAIGALKLLQTLDLEATSVRQLPSSVGVLTRLVFLRCSHVTRVPDGFLQKMTALEDLQVSVDRLSFESKAQFFKELGNLSQLRVLRVPYTGGMNESMQTVLLKSLGNLRQLQHLGMDYFTGDEVCAATLEWDKALFPKHLRHFNIGCICFPCVPSFINPTLLPNLSYLVLCVDYMDEAGLRALGELPELRYLRIIAPDGMPSHKQAAVVNIAAHDVFFRKLRFLWLLGLMVQLAATGASLSIWSEGQDAAMVFDSRKAEDVGSRHQRRLGRPSRGRGVLMPNLQQLGFTVPVSSFYKDGHATCDTLGLHLDCLPSLRLVHALLDCKGAFADDVNKAEAELRLRAEFHPNGSRLRFRFRFRFGDMVARHQRSNGSRLRFYASRVNKGDMVARPIHKDDEAPRNEEDEEETDEEMEDDEETDEEMEDAEETKDEEEIQEEWRTTKRPTRRWRTQNKPRTRKRSRKRPGRS